MWKAKVRKGRKIYYIVGDRKADVRSQIGLSKLISLRETSDTYIFGEKVA